MTSFEHGKASSIGASPPRLKAAQARLGAGLSATGPVHGWNGTGALTPLSRYAPMFSGAGMANVDGTEWCFPQPPTNDVGAVGNGLANFAQQVLHLRCSQVSQAAT